MPDCVPATPTAAGPRTPSARAALESVFGADARYGCARSAEMLGLRGEGASRMPSRHVVACY